MSASELERRLRNLIRWGVVSEVLPEQGLCRLSFGERVSPLSPWIAPRAGTDREFWHPDVGEQGLFLSPEGDGTKGVVLLGAFSTSRPLPARARADVHIREYGDGTRIEVDRAGHVVSITDSYGSAIRMEDGYIYLAPAIKVRVIQGGK